jgi:hypothetical protein
VCLGVHGMDMSDSNLDLKKKCNNYSILFVCKYAYSCNITEVIGALIILV